MPQIPLDDPAIVQMKTIVHRLFQLRQRFHVGRPEHIEMLKKRLFRNNRRSQVENVTDFDLFFNVGGIFTRQPGPLTMGELSRELNLPLSSSTRIVDWLVKMGYAQRLPDPDDRRVVRVALTESGVALYGEIDNFILERIERLMRGFSPEERVTFVGLFQKMLHSLEEEA